MTELCYSNTRTHGQLALIHEINLLSSPNLISIPSSGLGVDLHKKNSTRRKKEENVKGLFQRLRKPGNM